MVNSKDLVLTKEGAEGLKAEYRRLIDIERPAVIEQLQAARAMGDLSENADYDAARNKQAEIEGRIKEIEAILADAKIVVDNKKAKDVKLSNIVTYKDLSTNEDITVKIISSVELMQHKDSSGNDDNNVIKISNVCALGQALLGHSVGDTVTVKVAKPYDIEIVSIK